MKHMCELIITLGLCLVLQHEAAAKPIDREAGKLWIKIGVFLNQYPRIRYLDDDFKDTVLGAAKSDSVHIKYAAAYAAAFMQKKSGDDVWATLTEDSLQGVAQVAQVAQLLRKSLELSRPERFGYLCYELGKERGSYYKMFLINYIGHEYGADIWPVFLRALADHREQGVRHELLYHLAHSGPDETKKQVMVDVLKKEPRYQLDDYTAYAFGCITPGRSKRARENSTAALLRCLTEVSCGVTPQHSTDGVGKAGLGVHISEKLGTAEISAGGEQQRSVAVRQAIGLVGAEAIGRNEDETARSRKTSMTVILAMLAGAGCVAAIWVVTRLIRRWMRIKKTLRVC